MKESLPSRNQLPHLEKRGIGLTMMLTRRRAWQKVKYLKVEVVSLSWSTWRRVIDFCPPNFNPRPQALKIYQGKSAKLLTVLVKYCEDGIVANQSSATLKSKSHFWEETIQQ
jgi:hypothetical protein